MFPFSTPMLMAAGVASSRVTQLFATSLYTGNNSSLTVTNGIDLANHGGLVWLKHRASAAGHGLFDTVRGVGKYLSIDNESVETSLNGVSAFNADGFTLGAGFNPSGASFASWSFLQDPYFFKASTYTGNGAARAIPHGLDSSVSVGMVAIKAVNAGTDWVVWHRGAPGSQLFRLNTSAAATTSTAVFPTDPTGPSVSIGAAAIVNQNGVPYMMYVWAHNAAVDGSIQCGSTTGTISLPWAAQWILVKSSTAVGDWRILDTTRGWGAGNDALLLANSTSAETSAVDFGSGAAPTGFANPSIFVAIRAP